MSTFEILAAVALAIWLVQYATFGVRLTKAINAQRRVIEEQHPGAFQEFPLYVLSFP